MSERWAEPESSLEVMTADDSSFKMCGRVYLHKCYLHEWLCSSTLHGQTLGRPGVDLMTRRVAVKIENSPWFKIMQLRANSLKRNRLESAVEPRLDQREFQPTAELPKGPGFTRFVIVPLSTA
jgi:hypothetical protein